MPTLLASYAAERSLADHHVLAVSDSVHRRVMDLVAACAGGGVPTAKPPSRAQMLELARARAMLDVTYAGSKLVCEYIGPGISPQHAPAPGARFPDRWSTRRGPFLAKAASGIIEASEALSNVPAALVDAAKRSFDASIDALVRAPHGETHPFLYAVEGFLARPNHPAFAARLPTIAGHFDTLLDRSRIAFDELRQAVKHIESLADPTAGEVSVGCSVVLAEGFVAAVVQQGEPYTHQRAEGNPGLPPRRGGADHQRHHRPRQLELRSDWRHLQA